MGCMEQYDDEYKVCPYCGYIEDTKPIDALHMDAGSIIHERYIVGKTIGFGGFGVTYIGWDALLEHKIAIKEYMPSEFSTRALGTKEVTIFGGKKEEQFKSGLEKFNDEAKKLAKFSNDDGIVKVYDSFKENNTAYIIMEYLDGETLAEYLEREKKISYEKAVEIILPIASALKDVHEAGIIHRDIAPDNIFLTKDGKVKLIDFGAARFATTSHSRSLSVLIKQGYSPEEQYRSRGDQGAYTDVYALGAVMYRMITGEVPPDALERRAFYENKKKDILIPITKFCKDVPENKQNAIYNAMNVRIEDRTQSAEDFITELTTDGKVEHNRSRIKAIDFLKWPLWAKITIPSVSVVLITLGILMATGVIGFKNFIQKEIYIPDGMSRVPSVISHGLPEAQEELSKAVLLCNITGKEYSDLIDSNLVLNQSIDGGSVVMQNSIVGIVVSGGAELAQVPNVNGMYIEDARAMLEEAGFTVSTEKEYSDSIAEGGVISQSVEADTEYAVGKEIVLVISKGRDPNGNYEEKIVEVPDFTGKTYQEALEIAKEYGILIIAKEKLYSTEFEKDIIMKQNVNAGEEIKSGETIELTISLGKQVIKVPDVQFRTEKEAVEMIEKNNLKVVIKYEDNDTVQKGIVISQNPESGTIKSPGDEVTIIVSNGGSSFEMPDVTGMTSDKAYDTLTSRGISVSIQYEYRDSEANIVLGQSIPAGNDVRPGDSVYLTVSTSEKLISVPSVVGKNKDSAENTLKSAGFKVKQNSQYSNTVPEGNVISQQPASGSQQKKDSVVLINISLGKESVEIPDVKNISQSDAQSKLKNSKLNMKVSKEEYSDTVRAGYVISQTPSAGTSGFSGDTVSVVVSKGKPPIKPESISFREDNITISLTSAEIVPSGSSNDNDPKLIKLSLSIQPIDAQAENIKWTSSNENVAKLVDGSTGMQARFRAILPGSTVIRAETSDGKCKAECHVTVNMFNYIPDRSYDVPAGAGFNIPVIFPDYIFSDYSSGSVIWFQTFNDIPFKTNCTVSWSSSDTSIAEVDSNGNVTTLKEGKASITATQKFTIPSSWGCPQKSFTNSVTIPVNAHKEYSATINEDDVTVFKDSNYALDITWEGSNDFFVNGEKDSTMPDKRSFRSNDTNIATVNQDGVITGVSEGTTVIEYYDQWDGVIDSCSVTVKLANIDSGVDENIIWLYDKDTKVLEISGSGDMPTYRSYLNFLPPWLPYKDDIEKVVIKDGITSIENEVFSGYSSMTSIEIPDSVTYIGAVAFKDCTALTSIKIPNGLKYIYVSTFSNCSSLTSIDIPYGVEMIETSAFANCSSLTSINIPDSVTDIKILAFSGCSSLTSINIPNSVKNIGERAFENCTVLTSIDIPDSITTINFLSFSGCSSLTSVNIPNSVTNIVEGAFENCTTLTSIEIPESVNTLGEGVFYGCSNLESITIKNSSCEIDTDYDYHHNYIGEYLAIPKETVIYGYIGSTAEAYAKEYGNEFREIE